MCVYGPPAKGMRSYSGFPAHINPLRAPHLRLTGTYPSNIIHGNKNIELHNAILEMQTQSYTEAWMASFWWQVVPNYGTHEKPALASKLELKRKAVGERKVGARVQRGHGCIK